MDLTPLVNAGILVLAAIVTPIALMVANKAVNVARDRFGIQVSASQQAQIDAAVTAGAGIVRAKLATGTVSLDDVHIGNPHLDQAATYAMDVMGQMATASGVKKDDVAKMILGQVGHLLGADPQVPTVATQPALGAPAVETVPSPLPDAATAAAPVAAPVVAPAPVV